MKIDWEHETFESGLETWMTDFRGMSVEIRRGPNSSEAVVLTISAGTDIPLLRRAEPDAQLAMVNSLKWINGYWDELEDGPGAVYEQIDLPPEDTSCG